MFKIAIALASCALLGASCSVQGFTPVVLDKPFVAASLPISYEATITENNFTTYYGKYSFRYGSLSNNLAFEYYPSANIDTAGRIIGSNEFSVWIAFVKSGVTYSLNELNGCRAFYSVFPDIGFTSSYNNSRETSEVTSFVSPIDGFVAIRTSARNTRLMVNEGSTSLVYQPYAYGFSFDTPVTGARSCAMDMYWNDGVYMPRNSYLAFNYFDECILYTDGYKFDFGGDSDLQSRFLAEWLGAFASGTNRGFDWDEDYDGDYLVLIPLIDDYSQGAFCEFYIHDRYQAGYEDGYYASSAYEIIKDISRFEFTYYTGTGDAEESHSIVKTDTEARDSLAQYVLNGLLSVRSLVIDLTDGASDAHDIVIHLKYSQGKSIDASPLYIDYEAFTALVTQEFATHLNVYTQAVQVPWYVFNSNLEYSYQGDLKNYGTGLVSDRWRNYTDISIQYPLPDVGGRLNYIGILSGYSQGYADAMAESGVTIDDLTQRILDLEDDLSQYEGLTYEQIYNRGLQAGLNDSNGGVRTFNALFSNILVSPLTILNGLADISFFGMPILTAILSLLMVAMALWLFKRFK